MPDVLRNGLIAENSSNDIRSKDVGTVISDVVEEPAPASGNVNNIRVIEKWC